MLLNLCLSCKIVAQLSLVFIPGFLLVQVQVVRLHVGKDAGERLLRIAKLVS